MAIVFAHTGTLNNSGTIAGGKGGANGGGGNGGDGVNFENLSASLSSIVVNSGTIRGGDGGAPGPSNSFATTTGGIGIIGQGLTITNTGTIAGGVGSDGTRNAAIALFGGVNAIGPGGTITGGLELDTGSLTPALAGSPVGPAVNVNGTVFLATGSIYIVRVNGSANDSITATDKVTVAGATVSATVSGAALGRHTILTGASIDGSFASLSAQNSSPFLKETLAYDAMHVYLDVTGNTASGAIDFTTVAQTINQKNVALALNSGGSANGFTGPLITALAGLNAAQARAAFTSLDGEVATGAERAAFRFGDQFLNLMLNPFVDGRFDSTGGGSSSGFASEQQAELPPEMAEAYASVFKAPQPANFEQRWSLWNAGFGGSGKTSGDPLVTGSNDVRVSTYGFAGGMDYRFSPFVTVGLAAAGGGTNWGLSNGLGTGRSEAAQVGAYAKARIGAGYIAESIAFASHWFSTNRTALGDNLRASFTGESLSARIEGGYRFAVMPNFGFTPYAAAQAQAFRSGAYAETDTNNLGAGLSYAAKTATDIRTELGARFDNPTLLNGTPLIIRTRFAWAHDFVDTPSLSASFQTLPLSNFTVYGAAIPHDSGLASIGVDWYLNQDWKLLAKFDGEFAKSSDLYAGTVALRYSW